MLKKLLGLGIAFIMLFSFMACDLGDELEEYKTTGKSLIDAHIASKSQSDYTEDAWMAISKIVTDVNAAIDAATDKDDVNIAIIAAKESIDKVLKIEEMFLLSISVDETVLPQGEIFDVIIELKNISGIDFELTYFILFQANISPEWLSLGVIEWPQFPHSIHLQNNQTYVPVNPISLGIRRGSEPFAEEAQSPGQYELKVHANFYLFWGQDKQQEINIYSNTIILTVLEQY